MQSFEAEIDSLNNNISVLRKELLRRHSMEDANESQENIPATFIANVSLRQELEISQQEIILLKLFSDDLASDYNRITMALEVTAEKLVFAEVAHSQVTGVKPPEEFLMKLQRLWDELGVTPRERGEFCNQVENCFEFTCSKLLKDAQDRKDLTIKLMSNVTQEIDAMNASLKLNPIKNALMSQPLLSQLKELQEHHSHLKSVFQTALSRRDALASKTGGLIRALGISKDSLDPCLIALLESATTICKDMKEPKFDSCDLSDDFLTACDSVISEMHLRKSKILTTNLGYQDEVFAMVTEMNLTETDVMILVFRSVKQRLSVLPEWWDNETAESVVRSVMTAGGVVRSSQAFSKHLKVIHESLTSVATPRRQLSSKLRGMIERAQHTLLMTVDGEFEANAEYSNFHDALFRLPSLSKERIQACFTEIETLSVGVDVMTQSEIEALTVVWEALNISSAKRGNFWGSIDQNILEMDAKAMGPFDDVVALSAVDGEEWLLSATKKGTKCFRELESRLFKLEKIHEKVEELRTRQDAKSRIISLDSEVRILSAKLKEFEDKKCVKLRLTTKKCTSSTLLKEERFRKQMQLKFTAKLDQLSTLLKSWKDIENSPFDQGLLSDTVRMLLRNSDRNEFMHLRTVEYKGSSKRQADISSTSTETGAPPIKRLKVSERGTIIQSPKTEPIFAAKDRTWDPKENIESNHNEILKTSDDFGKSKARSPFGSTQSSTNVKPHAVKKKKLVLDPFGDILHQALSPEAEENDNHNEPFRLPATYQYENR